MAGTHDRKVHLPLSGDSSCLERVFANWAMNDMVFEDHLPPTSTAKTTTRASDRGPTAAELNEAHRPLSPIAVKVCSNRDAFCLMASVFASGSWKALNPEISSHGTTSDLGSVGFEEPPIVETVEVLLAATALTEEIGPFLPQKTIYH